MATITTTTGNVPLERLAARALRHLERLGYSRRSLRRYRTIWNHLAAFARENDLGDEYSEDLAERFVEARRPRVGEDLESSENWRRHVVFGIKVLGDFRRDGRIERSRTDMQSVKIPPAMKKPLRDYEQYCRDRRHLQPSTVGERVGGVAVFLDFLGLRNVQRFDQLQPVDLTDFVASRRRFRPKTVSVNVSAVRLFLRFLTMRGILVKDFSDVLPVIRVPRDATLPSVWDRELVAKMLEAVDRSSPRGKRDYAILLLASRLGLRVGDIRTLRLDDLNWEAATVEITQAKTAAPLQLPLSQEVGEALIDYLRSARPATDHREVFLKLRSPFDPFGSDARLYYIVQHWRSAAGIAFRTPQRQGLHSLRHTLATQLLQEDTPMHVISAILGHATTASTMIYAKADTEALRGAALDTEEGRHVE